MAAVVEMRWLAPSPSLLTALHGGDRRAFEMAPDWPFSAHFACRGAHRPPGSPADVAELDPTGRRWLRIGQLNIGALGGGRYRWNFSAEPTVTFVMRRIDLAKADTNEGW